jgi:hypothetical protein
MVLVQQMIADGARPAAAPLCAPASPTSPVAEATAVGTAEHAAEEAARLGAQLAAAVEAHLQPIVASLTAATTHAAAAADPAHGRRVADFSVAVAATQTEATTASVRSEPRLDRSIGSGEPVASTGGANVRPSAALRSAAHAAAIGACMILAGLAHLRCFECRNPDVRSSATRPRMSFA